MTGQVTHFDRAAEPLLSGVSGSKSRSIRVIYPVFPGQNSGQSGLFVRSIWVIHSVLLDKEAFSEDKKTPPEAGLFQPRRPSDPD